MTTDDKWAPSEFTSQCPASYYPRGRPRKITQPQGYNSEVQSCELGFGGFIMFCFGVP